MLAKYVFYSKSVAIFADLIPLSIALHHERHFCLGVMIPGYLYKNLEETSWLLRNGKTLTNFVGRLWFLQLWLNAIFEDELENTTSNDVCQSIEGFRIAYSKSILSDLHVVDQFKNYYS
jgi:hypothetical protein